MAKADKVPTFLIKLRLMLDTPEKYGDYIGWTHDGRAIEIKDEEGFARNPMLELFYYSNFNSFIRQLNVYGFRKTQRKLNERIYYHAKFNQSEPELVKTMTRKPRRQKFAIESSILPDTRASRVLPSLAVVLDAVKDLNVDQAATTRIPGLQQQQ